MVRGVTPIDPGYRRSAQAAHKAYHSSDWNAAFDHMHRASNYSSRSRAARGSIGKILRSFVSNLLENRQKKSITNVPKHSFLLIRRCYV